MLQRLQTSVLQHEILESLSSAAGNNRNEGWLSLTGIMAARGKHLPHSVIGMVRRRRVYRRSVDELALRRLVEVRTLPGKDGDIITVRITCDGQNYLNMELQLSA